MEKGRNVIEIYQNLLSFQNFFSFVDNLRFCRWKFLFAVFRSCVVRCFGGAAKASGIFQVCLNQVVFQ